MTKPLAKSLHTVTVLVRVAQALRPQYPHATNEGLVKLALIALGHTEAPDPCGLAAAALRQLEGGAK